MEKAISINSKRAGIADRTAAYFHNALGVDKTRAVDIYDVAKKIGIKVASRDPEGHDIKTVFSLADYNGVYKDRFALAKDVAKYVVLASSPNIDLNKKAVKSTIDDLALSLVIPKQEAMKLYSSLNALKRTDEAIAEVIARRYGVRKDVALKRLNQIKAEEYLKNEKD